MAASNTSFLHGWRLFVTMAVVLIAVALAAFTLQPDVVEGSRAAIRRMPMPSAASSPSSAAAPARKTRFSTGCRLPSTASAMTAVAATMGP